MNGFKRVMYVFAVVPLSIAAMQSGAAAATTSTEAYLDSYSDMGKKMAAWTSAQTALTSARSSMITATANAQAALVNAGANMVKSVATANNTNAQTLQTMEKTRTLVLDNNLKAAKTFYDKRNLHHGYRAQHARKRPGKDAFARYAKSDRKRLPNYQVRGPQGKVQWPHSLRGEEFLEYRVKVDSLFAGVGKPSRREAEDALAKMRSKLRSQISQMSPSEYMAARKFVHSVALETRMPQPVQAVAAK